jgi:hypothetical protein
MLVWKLVGKVLETILWRTDSLLSNAREINNETMTVARQHLSRKNGSTASAWSTRSCTLAVVTFRATPRAENIAYVD